MADYSNLEKVRLEKLNQLKDLGVDPYPRRTKRTHSIQDATEAFLAIEKDQDHEPVQAILTGRIR